MKVEVSSVSSFQRKLEFVLPASAIKVELDNAFRQYARNVRLPGFRPGKVPRRVLEGRFGPAIRDEVRQKLINDSWVKAMTEQNIEPVGQPTVDEAGELGKNSDFAFSILVDVRPDVTLETWTGLDVDYPVFAIADEELDAAVANRLEGAARLVEVTDRGVELGDMVMVELVAKDGDEEVAREFGTMIRTAADPYYPGIEAELVGLRADEEKDASVSFGEHARSEEVAGRTLDVHFKVLNIQANQVPELTDEVADELGFEGGVSGMREAVKAQLSEGREEMSRNQARANMLEKLIAVNPFEVPNGMIDNALNMLVQELKMQQSFRTGQNPKDIHFGEAAMADLRVRATFASKASLILEFVGKNEGIEVTDDDVEAKYQELADSQGQSVEAIKGWFTRDGGDTELRERILEEKTLEWLLERQNLVNVDPAEQAAKAAAEIAAAEAEPEEKPAKKKSKKAAKKEEAPAAEAAPAASDDVDTSVLNQAVGKLKAALADGSHDAHIDALIAAEEAGKNRKGALAALNARK